MLWKGFVKQCMKAMYVAELCYSCSSPAFYACDFWHFLMKLVLDKCLWKLMQIMHFENYTLRYRNKVDTPEMKCVTSLKHFCPWTHLQVCNKLCVKGPHMVPATKKKKTTNWIVMMSNSLKYGGWMHIPKVSPPPPSPNTTKLNKRTKEILVSLTLYLRAVMTS